MRDTGACWASTWPRCHAVVVSSTAVCLSTRLAAFRTDFLMRPRARTMRASASSRASAGMFCGLAFMAVSRRAPHSRRTRLKSALCCPMFMPGLCFGKVTVSCNTAVSGRHGLLRPIRHAHLDTWMLGCVLKVLIPKTRGWRGESARARQSRDRDRDRDRDRERVRLCSHVRTRRCARRRAPLCGPGSSGRPSTAAMGWPGWAPSRGSTSKLNIVLGPCPSGVRASPTAGLPRSTRPGFGAAVGEDLGTMAANRFANKTAFSPSFVEHPPFTC